MNNIDNIKPMKFYPLVMELENVLGSTVDIMELISLINREQFNELRERIVSTFQVGDIEPYSGEIGDQVEFGDISDAVRATTFSLYPQSTPSEKLIGREERHEWCNKILSAMDSAAEFY